MGMFDYLKCKAELPKDMPPGLCEDATFQTKSLACNLWTYTIREDGSLSVNGGESEEPVDDFTGAIEFYDIVPYRFVALYSRGRLLEIVWVGDLGHTTKYNLARDCCQCGVRDCDDLVCRVDGVPNWIAIEEVLADSLSGSRSDTIEPEFNRVRLPLRTEPDIARVSGSQFDIDQLQFRQDQ